MYNLGASLLTGVDLNFLFHSLQFIRSTSESIINTVTNRFPSISCQSAFEPTSID